MNGLCHPNVRLAWRARHPTKRSHDDNQPDIAAKDLGGWLFAYGFDLSIQGSVNCGTIASQAVRGIGLEATWHQSSTSGFIQKNVLRIARLDFKPIRIVKRAAVDRCLIWPTLECDEQLCSALIAKMRGKNASASRRPMLVDRRFSRTDVQAAAVENGFDCEGAARGSLTILAMTDRNYQRRSTYRIPYPVAQASAGMMKRIVHRAHPGAVPVKTIDNSTGGINERQQLSATRSWPHFVERALSVGSGR